MRILLCNKFYYRRGGDCVYVLNLEQLLNGHGHEVAVFAMDYPDNLDTPWAKYFPRNMGKLMALTRPFGSREVRRKFQRLLDDFRPDVVHLNNIHTQLSPVIARMAHEAGCRVVWTLHDTKLVCPSYTCMRNGRWCTECFADGKAVVRHRCVHGSLPASVIGYLEARKWYCEALQKWVDWFLPPSQFMMDTCVRGGYDARKFRVMCNFIDVGKVQNPSFQKQPYYVYLGRMVDYKGVATLCEAASRLPYKLVMVGGGPLLEGLRGRYAHADNIVFEGQKMWREVRPILEGAAFMTLPSEWGENNPLTVIEAQSLGTSVLGARIGGIPELIDEGVSGMTFTSGDVDDLKDKIHKMFAHHFDYEAIARAAVARYSSEAYYERLMEIYKK